MTRVTLDEYTPRRRFPGCHHRYLYPFGRSKYDVPPFLAIRINGIPVVDIKKTLMHIFRSAELAGWHSKQLKIAVVEAIFSFRSSLARYYCTTQILEIVRI
mgnify:CR=1 FL=1